MLADGLGDDSMTAGVIQRAHRGRWVKLRSALSHEFRHVVPPTIFFLGFNLVVFAKGLILADHLIQMQISRSVKLAGGLRLHQRIK